MEISVLNRTNQPMEEYRTYFAAIADRARRFLPIPKDAAISVTFVRSKTMHALNRTYRQIDCPTDVISFAARDYTFANMMDEEQSDLGDLFINIDYARRQAKRYGHSFLREVCFLFTHGLLHCLGYDHQTEEEEKEMFSLQDKILDPIVCRSE